MRWHNITYVTCIMLHHHITSHHITSHHITSHGISPHLTHPHPHEQTNKHHLSSCVHHVNIQLMHILSHDITQHHNNITPIYITRVHTHAHTNTHIHKTIVIHTSHQNMSHYMQRHTAHYTHVCTHTSSLCIMQILQ